MPKVPAKITPLSKPRQKLHKERIALYRNHRNAVGEDLLRSVLRALATIEAGDMVNSLLERRFGLNGVEIDRRELEVRIKTILRAEIGAIIAKHSILATGAKSALIRRLIAQIFPTKDNIPAIQQQNNPPRLRVEELESIIRREVARTPK